MIYGNTQQNLIRPSNHHPSTSSRWAEQAILTNGKKGGEGFMSGFILANKVDGL